MRHDFMGKVDFSLGEREKIDLAILKDRFTGCISVEKTDIETDKLGIDYIATLRKGAQIYVDGKTREKGCSKYWINGEPELALEIWSVIKTENHKGKIGWTLNEASNVDYILYTFDKSDTEYYYIFPFQMLKNAFRHNYKKWTKEYKPKKQKSIQKESHQTWESKAIFVPASVVIKAVEKEMSGQFAA